MSGYFTQLARLATGRMLTAHVNAGEVMAKGPEAAASEPPPPPARPAVKAPAPKPAAPDRKPAKSAKRISLDEYLNGKQGG